MKTKKLISLIITITMVMSLLISNSATVSATFFKDVNGYEFYAESAEELAIRGILTGYTDGEFKADRSITRAEMAKLVCALNGDIALQDAEDMMYDEFELPFKDVAPNHWAMPYILYASRYGIINGYTDGTFKPEYPVLHEEAVKMIVCTLGLDGEVIHYPNDWAKGYLEIAEEFGITKDCFSQRTWFVHRAHVAVMLYNAVKFIESGYAYPGDPEIDFDYNDESSNENDYVYEDDYNYNNDYDDEYYEDDYSNDYNYDYDDDYNDESDYDDYDEADYGTRGPGEYLLTFEKSNALRFNSAAGYYKPGDKITIRAFANKDYAFMSWSSDCGGEFYNVFKKETTFTMPANDVVIKASFIMDYGNTSDESEYSDNSDDSDSLDRYDGQNINLNKYVRLNMRMIGCGSYRDLTGSYHPGQVIELKIGAGDEGIFMGWSSDDVDLPTPNSPTCKIVMPDHDVTVTATFNN